MEGVTVCTRRPDGHEASSQGPNSQGQSGQGQSGQGPNSQEPSSQGPNSQEPSSQETEDTHPLECRWTLWAHLPHDTDWSVKSYKRIHTFGTAEEAIGLCEALPDKMVRNCMLFLMREGVHPTWEDPKNRGGGCFSYKVPNRAIPEVWKKLFYVVVGETASPDEALMQQINGITISPKKSFCIIKVWVASCKWKNPQLIGELPDMPAQGCIFKRHMATR